MKVITTPNDKNKTVDEFSRGEVFGTYDNNNDAQYYMVTDEQDTNETVKTVCLKTGEITRFEPETPAIACPNAVTYPYGCPNGYISKDYIKNEEKRKDGGTPQTLSTSDKRIYSFINASGAVRHFAILSDCDCQVLDKIQEICDTLDTGTISEQVEQLASKAKRLYDIDIMPLCVADVFRTMSTST